MEKRKDKIIRIINALRENYHRSVLAGDESKAWETVEGALALGVPPVRIYLEIVLPSQSEVGNLWHQGSINIAAEHQATQLSFSIMNSLRQRVKPAAAIGASVVVTSPEGEMHILGLRVVADFFFMDGWQVHFLGPDTPAKDLAEFVTNNEIKLAALSVTLPEHIKTLKQTIKVLKALINPPKIIVGGTALASSAVDLSLLGADAHCSDVLTVSQLGKELLGLDRKGFRTVESYLEYLGNKIQHLRKEKGINQQELADLSNLDRSYISALENGKQNVTLAALERIAASLGIFLDELLAAEIKR